MKNFYFYHSSISEKKPNYLICFYSGNSFSFEEFCNEVVSEFKCHIFTRDIFFITLEFNEEEINGKLFTKNSLDTIKDRINSFQELDFHLGFIRRNGDLKLNTFKKTKNSLSNKDANKLIEYGLYNLIDQRNLIVEAHSNIHFIKPSGKHTSKFIDVKNLLESSSEIIFIASTLLKLLPEQVDKIYIDTSGIYALAYELSNIIKAFDNNSKIIPIDSFGSYGGVEEYNFSSDDKTIILLSASTSNNLFERLKKNDLLEQASIISLITTQVNSGNQKSLIEFEALRKKYPNTHFEHFHSYEEAECPMCLKEHSIPITLDKSRFVFEAPRTEEYLPLAKDSDSNLRELIRKYKNIDAFKCLFDGVDGKKKPTPEYFIDVSKIITDDEFKDKVKNSIKRYFPLNTDCIIHCQDKGAKELSDLIHKYVSELDHQVKLYDGAIPNGTKPQKGIVVVAGSLESGKSLLNISRELRNFNDIPITYIVGFAKYNSESEFKKLQMDLKFSEGPCGFHQFIAIEKILLPINEHKEHSWDKELELLKTFEVKYKNDSILSNKINERITHLRKGSSIDYQGLGSNLFLESPTGNSLILGKTFAFWNKEDNDKEFEHQSTVYYTVSSVLQGLRTKTNSNGSIPLGKGYIIRQLDPLLFDRFNEGIIQASVLRSAKPRELDYSADDTKSRIIGSLIERMLKHPEAGESKGLPEILLALCTRKLQVKKDHLHGFGQHNLDKNSHPMSWMLAECVKDTVLNNINGNLSNDQTLVTL